MQIFFPANYDRTAIFGHKRGVRELKRGVKQRLRNNTLKIMDPRLRGNDGVAFCIPCNVLTGSPPARG